MRYSSKLTQFSAAANKKREGERTGNSSVEREKTQGESHGKQENFVPKKTGRLGEKVERDNDANYALGPAWKIMTNEFRIAARKIYKNRAW